MLRCVCLYANVFLLVVVFYSVSLHSMRCLSRCPECIPLLRLCFVPVHSFLFLLCFSTTFFKTILQCLRIYLRCRHTLEGKFFCRNIFEWNFIQPTPLAEGSCKTEAACPYTRPDALVLAQKSVR